MASAARSEAELSEEEADAHISQSQEKIETSRKQTGRKRQPSVTMRATHQLRGAAKDKDVSGSGPDDGTGSDASADGAAAASCVVVPPCITFTCSIPVVLLEDGLRAFLRRSGKDQGSDALAYRATGDALVDLCLELGDRIPDGAKMQMPYFKQRRRTDSRQSSAKYNHAVAPERTAQQLLDLLQTYCTSVVNKEAAASAAATTTTTATAATTPTTATYTAETATAKATPRKLAHNPDPNPADAALIAGLNTATAPRQGQHA